MCGPDLIKAKGGIVTVAKNCVNYNHWEEFDITYIPVYSPGNKIHILKFFLLALIKIYLFTKKNSVEVLYLHTAERGSFFRSEVIIHFFKKQPIILHHHAAEFEDFYAKLPKLWQKSIDRTLANVDVNIVLSKSMMNSLKSKSPNANFVVLHNAVNVPENNQYNINAKNILFLGQITKRKGVYDLLRVAKHLDNILDSEIHFFLCGNEGVKQVQDDIISMGLQKRVMYYGWVDANQKQQLFKTSMMNVLPSYNEGLPMSILECMAYGIPTISTNIAGIPELIIDGKNGLLNAPGDLKKLSSNIECLAKSKKTRQAFSNEAWETINAHFNLNTQMRELKNIIRHTLGKES